jgi:hypothetical protein
MSISYSSKFARSERQDGLSYKQLLEHPLYGFAKEVLPDLALAELILGSLTESETVSAFAERANLKADLVVLAASSLAKMGLLRLLAA